MNRTYAEVLVEQNCNGAMDTAYVYGTGRLSLDRFDGSTGYYLYDPKGSVTGITNGEGQICLSYRYGDFGEITYGAPQYENIYAYNGEAYNPNVGILYLRARYYNVAAGAFFTEDSYLGSIREPLTLNRYAYCVGNPVNYVDPSGKSVESDITYAVLHDNTIPPSEKGYEIGQRIQFYHALVMLSDRNATTDFVLSYDYNSGRDFFNETLAKADEYRWNIRMGMALAEELQEIDYPNMDETKTTVSREEAYKIAINVTTILEGNYGVANNFDNQGMSVGRVQSNLETESLQSVLKEYFNNDELAAIKVLGNEKYAILKEVINWSSADAVAWAAGLQNDEDTWTEWKNVLKEMSMTEEYKQAEENTIISDKLVTLIEKNLKQVQSQ